MSDNYPEAAGHGSDPLSEIIASSRGMDNDPEAMPYDSYDWDAEEVDEIIKNYKLGRSPQPRHIQSDFAAQRQHAGSELLPEVAGSIDVDYAWPAG